MTLVDRSLRRQLTAAMALAMALALLLSGTALAQTTAHAVAAVTIDDSCNDVPDDEFPDVPETNTFDDEIECLKAYGITVGKGDGTYDPSGKVSRWEMALFIHRLAKIADDQRDEFALPAASDQGFNDLGDLSDEAKDAINILAAMGVVQGKDATTYDPFSSITRAQMASFVNRLQGYIQDKLGGDASGFPAGDDAFPDDDASVHEDNINAIAGVGIVQGKSNGDYDGNQAVTRGQMAAFIMRHVEVNVNAGVLTSAYPPANAGDNQTFSVTPDSDVALTVATPDDNSDDRQYTVSNPVADTTHSIALVDASEVMVASNGEVTFGDDEGTANAADDIGDAATAAAHISVVNGAANGDDYVEVMPSGGAISFTVDGDADGTVTPIVFFDADGDDALDLDSDDAPVDSEVFGIGGSINFNPTEATQGPIAIDQAITEVDDASRMIVAGGAVYYYDANDTFYVDTDSGDDADPGEQVTLSEFEAETSVGDDIEGVSYQPNPDLSSVLLLDDKTPTALTGLTVTPSDTTAVVTVDTASITSGATVKAKVVADGGVFADAAVVTASSTTDADSGTAEFQLDISGLQASTNYEVFVYQSVDGEDSATVTAALDTTATLETVPPTITDTKLETDASTAGIIDDHDVITLIFSEDMADGLDAGLTNNVFLRLSDSDSVYQLSCQSNDTAPTVNAANDCNLDLADDTRFKVDVGTDANDLLFVSGTDNNLDVAGDTVTITLLSPDFDDEAGNQVDLAGSADVVVDDES